MAFSTTTLQFNGTTQYAKMGDVLGFEYSDAFSIGLWFKTTDVDGYLVSKMDGTPTGYGVYVKSTGALSLILAANATNKIEVVTLGAAVNDGAWHHCLVTYDGSGDFTGVKIYIDSVLRLVFAPSNNLASTSILNSAELNFAGNNNGSNLLNCKITLPAIYDVALNAVDVDRIYNDGNTYDATKLDTSNHLVGWWVMTNPLSALDLVAANTGTLTNMDGTNRSTVTPGGGSLTSLSFDGSTEYVNMGNVLSLERTNAFSLSAWIKTTGTDGVILGKMQNVSPWRGYALATMNGKLRVELVNTTSGNWIAVRSETLINDNLWHHVLVTYDGSSTAAGATLYIDGTAQTPVVEQNSLSSTIVTTNNFRIGSRDGGWNFTGLITEAAVWQKQLTSPEVTAVYNSGSPPDLKTLSTSGYLTAYWKLGDVYLYDAAKSPTVASDQYFGTAYYRQPEMAVAGGLLHFQATSQWSDAMSFYPGVGGVSQYSTRLKNNTGSYGAGPLTNFGLTSTFSLSIWFKFSAFTGPKHILTQSAGGYDGGVGWSLYAVDAKLKFSMYGITAQRSRRVRCDTLYNDGAWHHVVITHAGSLIGDIKMYVDGALKTLVTEQDSGSGYTVPEYNLGLGAWNDSVTTYSWDGWLSDAAIYNIALDLTQVGEIYNSGVPNDLEGLSTSGNLMYWWPLGSTPDTRVQRNSTLTSMTSLQVSKDNPGGVARTSIEFRTVGYLSLGNVYNFERDQPFSWSGWFKTTNALRAETLWSKIDSTNAGYNAWVTSAGSIYAVVGSTNTNKIRKGTTATGFNDGNWHHVVVTYNGGSLAAGLKIYVDGSLQPDTVTDDTLTTSILDSAVLSFGGRPDPTGSDFTGNLAEFSLYGKELSGTEVTEIYNSGAPADPSTLTSQPYLLEYWPLGHQYSPPTLVAEASSQVVADNSYFSDLTTEKTWNTVANYVLGAGESSLTATRRLFLDMKNKLVAYAGYTVIGSCNSVVYEYEGSTAGGSYGGDSTGPFDVWEDYTDLVWRDSDLGQGICSWAVLRSPLTAAGQFWILLWYYSSNDYYARIYAAGVKPTLRSPPLELVPFPTTGQPYHNLLLNAQLWDYVITTGGCKTYFSGCPTDGSFFFARQSPARGTYWSALQMFHVVTEDIVSDWTMKSVGYGLCWTTNRDQRVLSGAYCWLPEEGAVYASLCTYMWDYGTANTVPKSIDQTDALTGDTVALPVYIQTRAGSITPSGSTVIVGRLSDVFLSPTGIAEGSMAPEQAPYKYTCLEGYLWLPGNTEPTFS